MTEVTLPCNRTAPAAARASLSGLGQRLPAPDFHDLRIVVTELVTNAVRFGSDDRIRLRVEIDDRGTVHGEVIDGGEGGAVIDDERESLTEGLGLQIVDAICDAWGSLDSRGTVWFEMAGQPLVDTSQNGGTHWPPSV